MTGTAVSIDEAGRGQNRNDIRIKQRGFSLFLLGVLDAESEVGREVGKWRKISTSRRQRSG